MPLINTHADASSLARGLNFGLRLRQHQYLVYACSEGLDESTHFLHIRLGFITEPRSAVGNMSANRCESDCRSRGREFNPGPVPYFRGDYEIISAVILLPYAESFKKVCCQLQVKVCARCTG